MKDIESVSVCVLVRRTVFCLKCHFLNSDLICTSNGIFPCSSLITFSESLSPKISIQHHFAASQISLHAIFLFEIPPTEAMKLFSSFPFHSTSRCCHCPASSDHRIVDLPQRMSLPCALPCRLEGNTGRASISFLSTT